MSATISHTKKKILLAPELRFKGFYDEWIDTRLKDITNLITKGTTPKSFSSEGINYVKIEGLVGVKINKEKCLYINEETHFKELRRSILQNNDLLFAIAGATIGKVAIVTEDILPANTNQALAIIRLKSIKSLKYVLQILQSRIMKKYINESISVGAQPNLNLEQMGDFRFHLPSLPEQQKIASFLSTIDEKIQQLTRKKELLEQYKKGVVQQLFSGKLRFKDENGREYPKWKEKRLGDVATFYNGKAYKQTELLDSGKYKVLRVGNFFSNSSWYYSNLELEDNKYCENGDLLYAWSASFGPKIWEGDKTIYHYHIWRVDNNKLITKQFLFHILNNQTEVIKTRSSNGFALLHITKGTIESWKFNMPSIEEQKIISSFVDQLNKRSEIVNKQITQTQTFKKGLLQQMFV